MAPRLRPAALLLLSALGMSGPMVPGQAGAEDDTGAQLEALRAALQAERAAREADRERLEAQARRLDAALARIESLEREGAPPAVSGDGSSGAPAAGLEIYGFTQLDAIYDTNRMDPAFSSTLRPSRIPVLCPADPGCGKDGETILSARQSRLGFRGRLPTGLGTVETLFEFDLFSLGNAAGEHNFRIRHAWGELGPVGAGQYWSVFMDPSVFPETIDYWGPPGMVYLRNPQVRWTPIDDGWATLALSLEAPSSAIDSGKVGEISPGLGLRGREQFPDLAAHVRLEGEPGHVQLAGVLRSDGFESPTETPANPSGNRVGWGVNLAGELALFARDRLKLQVVYGEGIASYLNDGGIDLAPDADLRIRPIPILGWLAYYDHWWSERWSSSLGYSETRQRTLEGQLGSAFALGQYASANLLWRPVGPALVGAEVLWGWLELLDGSHGTDTRVQVSFRYDFGAAIGGGSE